MPTNKNSNTYPDVLDLNQILEITKAATISGQKSLRNFTLLMILFNSDFRISELQNLRIKDIDFVSKKINVKSKTGASRHMNLLGFTVLRDYLTSTIQYPSSITSIEELEDRYVFSNGDGNTPISIRILFNKLLSKVASVPKKEINRFTLRLRHTIAFYGFDKVVDSSIATKLLAGNEKMDIPMYLQLFAEHLKTSDEKKFDIPLISPLLVTRSVSSTEFYLRQRIDNQSTKNLLEESPFET
jgi:site-specific recombinase XerD